MAAATSRTAQQVLTAVRKVLAGHTSADERKRADAFLQTFQRTPEAIPVSMALLSQSDDDVLKEHEHLFLVNTIYRALCSRGSRDHPRFKSDASIGASELLRPCFAQLCTHIHGSIANHTSSLIASQYACCVAVSILSTTEGDVLTTLSALSSGVSMPSIAVDMAVITLLQLLPEEIQNKRLLLRKDHRESWVASIKTESPQVLHTLQGCWSAQVARRPNTLCAFHARLEERILETFGAWVVHGALAPDMIAASSLLAAACDVAAKMAPESDRILDVLQDIVATCVDASFAPLLSPLLAFSTRLGSQAFENAHDLRPDLLIAIASTVASVGEQALVCGLLTPLDPMPTTFLDMLLALATLHETEALTKVFDFWVAFRARMVADGSDAACAWDAKYIPSVLRHVVASTSLETAADEDELVQHRKEMRAVLRLLSQASPDAFLHELLGAIFAAYETLTPTSAPSVALQIEAALHALSALTKCIPDSDETYMPRLLHVLYALASPDRTLHARALLRTITVFLSVVPTWIRAHPASLPYVHGILTSALACAEDDPICAMRNAEDHIGAVALLKLATKCAPQLLLDAADLDWLACMRNVYRANLQPTPFLSDKSLRLVLEAYARVLIGATEAAYQASDVSYYVQGAPHVLSLANFMCEHLVAALPHAANDEAAHAVVSLVLGHLSTLASALLRERTSRSGHPLLAVLQTHWAAVFQPLLACHVVQTSVMELFETLFKSLERDAAPLATATVPLLVASFSATRHRCVIDTLQATLRCASPSSTLSGLLQDAVLRIVRDTAPSALASDGADRLDGVCGLVVAFGIHEPTLLEAAGVLPPLLALLLEALAAGPYHVLAVLKVLNALWLWRSDALAPLHMYVTSVLSVEMATAIFRQLLRAPASTTDAVAQCLLNARRSFPAETLRGIATSAVHDQVFAHVSQQTQRDMLETYASADPKIATPRKLGRFVKLFSFKH
ncbi:hypothetical protein SPRG_06198 [Saprolegnia parasitica CBS 223.65]|uniref:Exportin-1/Importin-beta-like domain-containing protein n=1 Tax=Saprolegnia parasitica (strain CBS 223.65) TaxID=695850 RepID=A0A067CNP9_SAPPC|nr:hypothetical protein SPRG_06198 [Saprolegnia parasitica CBS 223.65]KDO28151.1 hypothetical protein SPRG_06198 [Saprolegnia parasitica CBS 223.65]|eukprot:XP_012200978.1 hypothetical protein SPRG_06198 [Saprolegnia parasitica CBS 223.65]